jgi:hypothetical protein
MTLPHQHNSGGNSIYTPSPACYYPQTHPVKFLLSYHVYSLTPCLLLHHIYCRIIFSPTTTKTHPPPPHHPHLTSISLNWLISPCHTVWIMDWQKTWLIVIYCCIIFIVYQSFWLPHLSITSFWLLHSKLFIVVSCLLLYHVYCRIMFIVVSYLLSYHCYCCIIIIVVSIVMTMIPTVLNPNLTVTGKDMYIFWKQTERKSSWMLC